MSRTWTRAASVAAGLVLTACGGSNSSENHIKPIRASLAIDPFSGTPDPAVFLAGGSTTGDLAIVEVRLHTTTLQTFDSLTLEFHFDPSLVHVGNEFLPNPAVLGDCNSGGSCAPFCFNNAAAANTSGVLLIGISRNPDPLCAAAAISADTTLLSIGFVAATTIDPPGTRIVLFTDPVPAKHGDCEILQYGTGSGDLIDLGIPCTDGNATLTATR